VRGRPPVGDYFLIVLVVHTAVAAMRLLVHAVAWCLCNDGAPAAAHHHHHHDHSPTTSGDVDDEDAGPWGSAGMPIFGQPGHVVPPPRPTPSGRVSWWSNNDDIVIVSQTVQRV
jgi:hypothetical protein